MKSIFDWIKQINQYKGDVNSFSDADWELWNSYMVHRFISQNIDFLPIVNEVQSYPPQSKKEIYSIYKEYIPKNNKWNKYIKSSNKKPNKDLINHLKDHFKVSVREVKDYLRILDTTEIFRILTDRGLEKKEIKPLLK